MKRYENYEQAKLIQNHLIETYEGYGYRLVEVPKDTNKSSFILDEISK
jgi:predicted ATPase